MRRCWRWMDALPAQPGPGAGSRGLVPDHGRHLGYRRRVPSVLGILADCAYSSARRHSLIGLRGSCRSPWCGGGASNEEVNMAHFSVLPPEINSLRMYLGAGSAPMLQAAAAWDGLAAELGTAASSFSSVTTGLTGQAWQGPASAAMAAAAAPYAGFLTTASAQAQLAAGQAKAVASVFEAAKAAIVPPAAVAANREAFLALIRSNWLGLNAPWIAAVESLYEEYWAADVAAMTGYHAGASQAAAQLPLPAGLQQFLNTLPNLGIGNQGNANLGGGNTGSGNIGNGNKGSSNLGGGNIGNNNIGSGNRGSDNFGAGNVGTGNIGFGNQGPIDVNLLATPGQNNVGLGNIGNNNMGFGNTGDANTGGGNTGNGNIGGG
ncbi:putative PPE family protein, partial [Mycobacterium tuberculosis SUMu012]